MSKLLLTLLVSAGLGLTGCASQQMTATRSTPPPAPMTKDAYDMALTRADAQARVDKEACSSRTGNAKDICLAEANGKEKIAKADAEASYRNTPKTREDVRDARAEAAYRVAKEKCDELAGNPKDVCVKEADAALVRAKADAKVDRVATDAQRQSAVDKRDADYNVAIEKCDAFSGSVKNTCVNDAKLRFGKS